MREEKKKRKKRKLRVKRFLILLGILLAIILIIIYILNLNVRQIEITGTNLITDNEIIEVSGLKNYPKLFSISSSNLKKKIKTLDLVNDVKISKNLYGKVAIKVDEAKVLFYNKNNDKIVLSNGKEMSFSQNYLGVPTLLNYVPQDIYNELIKGMTSIDNDILRSISEIEYAPSKTMDGQVIDDTRFLLRMNDTNTVYMNTINIKQLNKYMDISSAVIATQGENRGILYLDSSTAENFSFESYESIKRAEEEEAKKKEEEEKKNESEQQHDQN